MGQSFAPASQDSQTQRQNQLADRKGCHRTHRCRKAAGGDAASPWLGCGSDLGREGQGGRTLGAIERVSGHTLSGKTEAVSICQCGGDLMRPLADEPSVTPGRHHTVRLIDGAPKP